MLELTDKNADPNAGAQSRPAKQFRPPSPEDCFESLVPEYALLFFDHLSSEFLTFKPDIADQDIIKTSSTY